MIDAGQFDLAKSVVPALGGWPHRAKAYREIAAAQTRAGDLAAVLKWSDTLKEDDARAEVLAGAAKGLLDRKRGRD